jgi:hypothetical protein
MALLAVSAAGIVAAILILDEDRDKIQAAAPSEASVEALRSIADSKGHLVYWAGRLAGFKTEVTETTQGRVFIRYLPREVPIGDPRPAYTTVATYPRKDAFRIAERAGKRKAAVRRTTAGGGIAVFRKDRPTSVYLAYPNSDVLIEVYAPSAASARDLALSGRVEPIK